MLHLLLLSVFSWDRAGRRHNIVSRLILGPRLKQLGLKLHRIKTESSNSPVLMLVHPRNEQLPFQPPAQQL